MPPIMTNLHTESHNLRNMGFCPDSPGKKAWRFSSLGRASRTALFASREHASTRRQAVRASPLRRSTRRRAPPCLPPFRALRTSTRAPAPRRARALLPPRFKRVVARYGPAYPAAAARGAGRAPAPGHAAPRRAHAVDRGRGQPGEGPPERRPRRRVRRLEVPPHGACRGYFKNTRAIRQRANDD